MTTPGAGQTNRNQSPGGREYGTDPQGTPYLALTIAGCDAEHGILWRRHPRDQRRHPVAPLPLGKEMEHFIASLVVWLGE